jgi:hypothetical protein
MKGEECLEGPSMDDINKLMQVDKTHKVTHAL